MRPHVKVVIEGRVASMTVRGCLLCCAVSSLSCRYMLCSTVLRRTSQPIESMLASLSLLPTHAFRQHSTNQNQSLRWAHVPARLMCWISGRHDSAAHAVSHPSSPRLLSAQIHTINARITEQGISKTNTHTAGRCSGDAPSF